MLTFLFYFYICDAKTELTHRDPRILVSLTTKNFSNILLCSEHTILSCVYEFLSKNSRGGIFDHTRQSGRTGFAVIRNHVIFSLLQLSLVPSGVL